MSVIGFAANDPMTLESRGVHGVFGDPSYAAPKDTKGWFLQRRRTVYTSEGQLRSSEAYAYLIQSPKPAVGDRLIYKSERYEIISVAEHLDLSGAGFWKVLLVRAK